MTRKVPYSKPHKTLEQQVALLKQRGMSFEDEARARATLRRVSYYRLSAYWYIFRQNADVDAPERFREGTSFDEAVWLYDFDRKLRVIMMEGMELFEILVRTRITYLFTQRCGPFGHLNRDHFKQDKFYYKELARFSQAVCESNEVFLKHHYKSKYEGYPDRVPFWMLTEVISMGALSRFYKLLNQALKGAIASDFGLGHAPMQSWLHSMTYVRNTCAHHSRFWNRRLAVRPSYAGGLTKSQVGDNDTPFFAMLALLYLLRQHDAQGTWPEILSEHLLKLEERGADYASRLGMMEGWQWRLLGARSEEE